MLLRLPLTLALVNFFLFPQDAGLNVQTYRYYDAKNIKLDFAAMCDDILAMPKGAAILLQACAHNPTGVCVCECE